MKYIARNQEDHLAITKRASENPDAFWGDYAKTNFKWHKEWDKVSDCNLAEGKITWFEGAKLNITENCIDRHCGKLGDQIALIWEPNDATRFGLKLTYNQLLKRVCTTANMLKALGVKKGDRVCLYMPMIPELLYTMLACARIGAVHVVVFAGFSAQALADRINDAECKWLVTADGGFRGKKITPLKDIADEALKQCACIEKTIVFRSAKTEINWVEKRDNWWHTMFDVQEDECEAEVMDAEDPLFILYTSGSTGKPKGMVHTCAGYMVYAEYSFMNVFQYTPDEVHWCTADIGWVTGHSYIVYGPLCAGATTVMYEGVPNCPSQDRFWQIIDKHKVNIFYTSPTAIRTLAQCKEDMIEKHDLSSLRVLGTVGEPINEEAWHWYHQKIGKGKCPIVDTWWQTETGGILISNLADVTPAIPCFATLPLPGIMPVIVNPNGEEITDADSEGHLCIAKPWPGMARTIYRDHQRFVDTYYRSYPGKYFTGDGAKRDEKGNYRITGRVDDVVIVSGHNLGTAELENCIDEHPDVVESAVVGYPHAIKGHAICAYVCLRNGLQVNEQEFCETIREWVSKELSPIAKPERVIVTNDLPKTRSGKIMRRILRKIAEGDTANIGDTSTLLNPECVETLKQKMGGENGVGY